MICALNTTVLTTLLWDRSCSIPGVTRAQKSMMVVTAAGAPIILSPDSLTNEYVSQYNVHN